jgi:hypothetical protein
MLPFFVLAVKDPFLSPILPVFFLSSLTVSEEELTILTLPLSVFTS